MLENRRIDLLVGLMIGYLIINVRCQGPQLKISPEQAHKLVPAKMPFFFACEGYSENNEGTFTEMKWINPKGEEIETTFQVEVASNDNKISLTFLEPRIEDSGIYNCSALFSGTIRLQASISVTFYEDLQWEDCHEQQSVVLGEPGKISCKVTSNPSPSIEWRKDKILMSSASNHYSIDPDGISIFKVENEDKGIYNVRAGVTVTGRVEFKNISVIVQIPPSIVELSEEEDILEGEEYVIRCHATGFPEPKYIWFNPQKRDLSDEDGFSVNSHDGTLTIKKVQSDSGGEYRCRAENAAGYDERTMKLTVIVKPVIHEFKNITGNEGEDIAFQCHVTGEPTPKVTIRKDGSLNPFVENEDNRITLETTITNGRTILTLTIKQIVRSDDGLYYCTAENVGARVESVGHLTVQFAPDMSSTPSTIVKTWPGNPANISCIAEAIPNATILWKYNNEVITHENTRYMVFGNVSYSNLLIDLSRIPSSNDIFGVYSCEAKNALGSSDIDIRLEEATIPGMLSQVMFNKVTSTTITFRLHGPSNNGGLPITFYVVKYRREDEPVDDAKTVEWPKDSPYILSGLKPRTNYKFHFAAKNAVGVGNFKDENYVMPDETVPEPPVFITAPESVSDFPDRFEIKWSVPDDNGEPIEYFEIRYFKVEREVNGWKQIDKAAEIKIKDWDTPVYELVDLSPGVYYKVELRANNRLGYSIPGTVVFSTRSGEPTNGEASMVEGGVLSLPGIIAIVVVSVLVILIVLDVTCYLRFHCGLLYVLRYGSCGQSPSSEKVRDAVVEDARACVKEVSTANNGKIKTETKAPSPNTTTPVQPTSDKQSDHSEEKTKTEVDNPAFDKEKEPLNIEDKSYRDFTSEDSPMIDIAGNKDGRPIDLIIDENFKNKSPKGSKTSIGKSSPV